MSPSIKHISVAYDPINENNTFSSGDYISGRVTLEVEKETEIQSFFVQAKGKASVLWTRRYGQVTMVFYDKETIFNIKHFFIQDTESGDSAIQQDQAGETYPTVVSPGRHEYPFTFQIPQQDMPSSYTGQCGKVVYSLKAQVSRQRRLSSKEKTAFTFVSRMPMPDPYMNEAQSADVEKKLHFLNSGDVSVHASINSTNYYLGDEVKITAEVHNNSSRAIKPKYRLYQKQSFYALGTECIHEQDIVKEEGEPIQPSSKKTVTYSLPIPSDASPTILNFRILKLEYYMKVYLDVKYSRDPGVSFPVGIFGPPLNIGGASASASVSAFPSAPPQEAIDRAEPPPPYESLYPGVAALSLNP